MSDKTSKQFFKNVLNLQSEKNKKQEEKNKKQEEKNKKQEEFEKNNRPGVSGKITITIVNDMVQKPVVEANKQLTVLGVIGILDAAKRSTQMSMAYPNQEIEVSNE